jgi:hypothetical protein
VAQNRINPNQGRDGAKRPVFDPKNAHSQRDIPNFGTICRHQFGKVSIRSSEAAIE